MHGNVWEWCQDWSDRGYDNHLSFEDPLGPDAGSERSLRGGSWSQIPAASRCAFRYSRSPSERSLRRDSGSFRRGSPLPAHAADEPYLEQAVPVTEAALLGSGDAPCNEVNYGWVKLLTESRVQFDLVERETKWEERYALVVLPENFWVDQTMAGRLQAFIAEGGAVIAAHTSGVLAGTETSWLEQYGLHYAGLSPFTPAYMVPQVKFTGDVPPYAYALYEGASSWWFQKTAHRRPCHTVVIPTDLRRGIAPP